jgi:hypothetical protein
VIRRIGYCGVLQRRSENEQLEKDFLKWRAFSRAVRPPENGLVLLL